MTGCVVYSFTSVEEKVNKSQTEQFYDPSSPYGRQNKWNSTNQFSQRNLQASLNSHKKSMACGLGI